MKRRSILVYSFILITSFVSVGHISQGTDNYFEITKNLSIFGKVYREINAFYVDDVDPTRVMRKGIDAMLESLDPYTNYISAGEIEDFRFISTGSYGGIGASVNEREGRYLVTEAYENDPAVEAGIKVGDEITAIDNEQIKGKNKVDIRTLLRGQAGSQVILTVLRPGETVPRKMTVTRKDVKIENVPYYGMMNEKFGYIALTGFTQDAGKEVRDAFSSLKKDNPKMEGLVLDLRGNLGGLLHEAVNVVSAFVANNQLVVETRGRIEGAQKKYPTHDTPIDTAMRMVVLVNGRSASASEIVSGAIQDLDRGIIVGTRSFGKGLVQTTRALNYGAQIKLTTAKYLIPSGRCVQALDYSRRYTDGTLTKSPDSLRKAFKTRNGRTVYDVSGIEPEVEVKQEILQPVTSELVSQYIIFDFATAYCLRHAGVLPAREFTVTDEMYDEFLSFVKSKNFSYETAAEKELSQLKDELKEIGQLDAANKEISALQNKCKDLKSNDFIKNKKEICEQISGEIIKRYYFRKGMIESSFENDPYITTAMKILDNPLDYKKKLGVK